MRPTSCTEARPIHAAFYICSLSVRVIVYKGMLMPEQLFAYFEDINDPDFKSHLAMVHSRFSTNTFPSWDRAQPLRFMSHNGEINTLRGNINKMAAREGTLSSRLFGDDLAKTFPSSSPISPTRATSTTRSSFSAHDRARAPRSGHDDGSRGVAAPSAHARRGRAMYEFMSTQMEPWDGPASIAFTDGHVIGAVLDRNGLRPSRYYVTDDDLVIMASEVGCSTSPREGEDQGPAQARPDVPRQTSTRDGSSTTSS